MGCHECEKGRVKKNGEGGMREMCPSAKCVGNYNSHIIIITILPLILTSWRKGNIKYPTKILATHNPAQHTSPLPDTPILNLNSNFYNDTWGNFPFHCSPSHNPRARKVSSNGKSHPSIVSHLKPRLSYHLANSPNPRLPNSL